MSRLQADAPADLWVPVTGSLGFRGRRHRKAAIGMLLSQANQATGAAARPGGGAFAWILSQAAPLLMRRAAGRVLVWVWKSDPELLVVMAQLQEATPQARTARAMMPMEYDDTESFPNPFLGVGEKLAMPLPSDARTPAVRDLHVGHGLALRDRHGGVRRPGAVRHGHRGRGCRGPHDPRGRRPAGRRIADGPAARPGLTAETPGPFDGLRDLRRSICPSNSLGTPDRWTRPSAPPGHAAPVPSTCSETPRSQEAAELTRGG